MRAAHFLTLSLGIVLVIGCKPKATQSDIASLENFASQSLLKTNVCVGPTSELESASVEHALAGLYPNASSHRDIVRKALSAVPQPLRDLFSGLNGEIIITATPHHYCNTNAMADYELTACYRYRPGKNGRPRILQIILPDNAATIGHGLVRQFGYLFAQRLSRLDIKTSGEQVTVAALSSRNPGIQTRMEAVAEAFLSDLHFSPYFGFESLKKFLGTETEDIVRGALVGNTNQDGRGLLDKLALKDAKKRRFVDAVFAEAFDSYYCNAYSEVDPKVLAPLKTKNVLKLAELGQVLSKIDNTRVIMSLLFNNTLQVFNNIDPEFFRLGKRQGSSLTGFALNGDMCFAPGDSGGTNDVTGATNNNFNFSGTGQIFGATGETAPEGQAANPSVVGTPTDALTGMTFGDSAGADLGGGALSPSALQVADNFNSMAASPTFSMPASQSYPAVPEFKGSSDLNYAMAAAIPVDAVEPIFSSGPQSPGVQNQDSSGFALGGEKKLGSVLEQCIDATNRRAKGVAGDAAEAATEGLQVGGKSMRRMGVGGSTLVSGSTLRATGGETGGSVLQGLLAKPVVPKASTLAEGVETATESAVKPAAKSAETVVAQAEPLTVAMREKNLQDRMRQLQDLEASQGKTSALDAVVANSQPKTGKETLDSILDPKDDFFSLGDKIKVLREEISSESQNLSTAANREWIDALDRAQNHSPDVRFGPSNTLQSLDAMKKTMDETGEINDRYLRIQAMRDQVQGAGKDPTKALAPEGWVDDLAKKASREAENSQFERSLVPAYNAKVRAAFEPHIKEQEQLAKDIRKLKPRPDEPDDYKFNEISRLEQAKKKSGYLDEYDQKQLSELTGKLKELETRKAKIDAVIGDFKQQPGESMLDSMLRDTRQKWLRPERRPGN